MKPLVSVVVPMYKVENYIAHCLDSIINQTYTNLQILVINDGSPDRSRNIAETYQDSRIQIIDKDNGGLSDARNAGMKQVEGEYTVFVDSDDWLAPAFIETTLKLALSQKAGVVQASFYYAYPDKLFVDISMNKNNYTIELLDNSSLMKKLVENLEVKNFAWGKIYLTKLIRDIPFQKGVLFEDMFWAHLVMARVKAYVIHPEPLYYYRQREESIVGSYSLKHLDIIEGMKERLTFIADNYSELTPAAYRQLGNLQLQHYRLLLTVKPFRLQKIERSVIQKDLEYEKKAMLQSAAEDYELSKKLKMFYVHPYLYLALLIVNKLKRKVKKNFTEEPLVRITKEGVSS